MNTTTLASRAVSHRVAVWLVGYSLVMFVAMAIATLARRRIVEPFLGSSLAAIAAVIALWIVYPRAALYVTMAATAVSDVVTVSWFPFLKNFSSRESVSFVADAATISPLDIALATGATVSLLRCYAASGRWIRPHPLTRPVIAFTACVLYGFIRGITSGGDMRIAVLTGRPLFYIGLTFILVVNECHRPEHRARALTAVGVGVLIQSLLSIDYLNGLDPATRDGLEGLTEHGSALGQNAVLLAFILLFVFGLRQPALRTALFVMVAPVGYVFLVGQRRAGVAALLVAGVLTAMMLFWRRRGRFWLVAPITSVVFTGYVAAFWNSSSSIGFPAQAVRTVIAPDTASAKDRSSDLYRLIEAYDLSATIRADPLAGFGFGRPFLRPVELPDISAFELNAYQPHNSVLWIWISLGFVGFATMFYLFARALMVGTEQARRASTDGDFLMIWLSTLYVAMYAVYSYVDVAWDARNTVFLGLALACTRLPAGDVNDPESSAPSRTERHLRSASAEPDRFATSAV